MIQEEKRKYKREEYRSPFDYAVTVVEFKALRKVQSSGVGVDICEEGLGFMTDLELEPGHVLRLQRGNSHVVAMVKWVEVHEGRFRVGGVFV